MSILSQYSMIPSKLKEQWNRLPANSALIGGALIAAAGLGYLGYRLATQNPLQLSSATVEAIKRVTETTPMEVGSGQIVNIHGANYLIVKKEDGQPDAFILAEKTQKLAGAGHKGVANRICSLYTNTYSSVIKVPISPLEMEKLRCGIQMISLVNPDGKTRGCIKTPYPVTEIDANRQPVLRGILMDAYDSDADVATRANGIIADLHAHPNSEIYFLDMFHQALSILVKLQETGVAHGDILARNIFVTRDADGFINFHLGDWDEALNKADSLAIESDLKQMIFALHEIFNSSSLHYKPSFLPFLLHRKSTPQQLLAEINQELISKAGSESSSLWAKAAERAGLVV